MVARLQSVGRVGVGFIALAGVAAEIGVVMQIYLEQAMAELKAERAAEGYPLTRADLRAAIMRGAVERVRPKMMTVMAGLLPISGAPAPARR